MRCRRKMNWPGELPGGEQEDCNCKLHAQILLVPRCRQEVASSEQEFRTGETRG